MVDKYRGSEKPNASERMPCPSDPAVFCLLGGLVQPHRSALHGQRDTHLDASAALDGLYVSSEWALSIEVMMLLVVPLQQSIE